MPRSSLPAVDGFLANKNGPSGMSGYAYSSRGELLEVVLPDGKLVTYEYDPLGRRIAKYIDGQIIEKYLWADMTTLLAVYDGADNLIVRFEYADSRLPVSMTSGGGEYFLMYDQVGSLRVVSDSSGTIVKQIDYDSFGNVLYDSNSAFSVPFGFAGGLYDTDTGLVRFGFRDYDPALGRWTAKDPIDFAGGDWNLYGYVQSNPVNWVDPEGLARDDWWDPRFYYDFWGDAARGARDFSRNYQNMREANTIGADRYFHCMANCQASREGLGGRFASEVISEGREYTDYLTGDTLDQCYTDTLANEQGRNSDSSMPCEQVCGSLRPAALDPRW